MNRIETLMTLSVDAPVVHCGQKVWGVLAGTERWRGSRPCAGRVVICDVSTRRGYCRKHVIRFHEYCAAMNRGTR